MVFEAFKVYQNRSKDPVVRSMPLLVTHLQNFCFFLGKPELYMIFKVERYSCFF